MRRIAVYLFASMLVSCFWGAEPSKQYPLTGNFRLHWWGGEEDTKLVYGADDGTGYEVVVPGVVFAAGADSDFILLERHPDRIAEIEARLWGDRNENGWRLADPRDTIYFDNRQKGDSIYRIGADRYHRIGGWTPPDSLRNPYRRVTIHTIVDLRPVRSDTLRFRPGTPAWRNELLRNTFEYASQQDFEAARAALGVPDSLGFTVRIASME